MGARLVLLGPPGSGKGTLAKQLQERLAMRCLSTGEMLRQEIRRSSAVGRAVQRYVQSGRLVPDTLVVTLMTGRLPAALRRRGFVLDGFPRTDGQARGLDAFLARTGAPLHGVCYLACTTNILIRRLMGRRVCGRCGAIYHLRNMLPKHRGLCDRCGSRLVTRTDDEVSTIRRRLAVDRKESKPLLAYFARQGLLVRMNARGGSEVVYRRALRIFRQRGWVASPRG